MKHAVSDKEQGARPNAVAREICGVCKTRYQSRQWDRGACKHCGAPVCFQCWSEGRRLCADHAAEAVEPASNGPKTTKTYETTVRARPACGRCRRVEPLGPPTADGTAYCSGCQKALANERGARPSGAVTAAECRYRETLFFQFVEDGIRRMDALPGSSEWRVSDVRVERLARSHEGLQAAVQHHPYREGLRQRLPDMPESETRRLGVVYQRGRVPLFRRRTEKTLALVPATPRWALLEHGYATGVAGEEALNASLNEVQNANDRPPSLSILFSPTGWREDLAIPSGVALAELDPNGGWRYRANLAGEDDRALADALFAPRQDSDAAYRALRERLDGNSVAFPLSARSFAEDEGYSLADVTEAFQTVTERERGLVLCNDDERRDLLLDMR